MRPGAETFGGFIGAGLKEAGAQVESVADTWLKLQLDGQVNKALEEVSPVINNYRDNVHGQDAIDQQQAVHDQIKEIVARHREGLTPRQQAQYDVALRNYEFRLWNGEITTHAAQAISEVARDTNKKSLLDATDRAAKFSVDPTGIDFSAAVGDASEAMMAQERFNGNSGNPQIMEQARKTGEMLAYKAAAERIYATDRAKALQFVRDNEDKLGAAASQLEKEFRTGAEQEQAEEGSTLFSTISKIADPAARAKAAHDNAAILGPAAVSILAGEQPAVEPPSNVVPLRPGTPATPRPSPWQYWQRQSAPAATPVPGARAENFAPTERPMANEPAQQAIADVLHINYEPNPQSQADPRQAPIRTNNPGAQWPSKIAEAYGSTGHEELRDGNKIATFPTPIHGAAANMALLADRYSGMTVGEIQRKWSGQHRSELAGYPSNMTVTPAMLSDRNFMVTFMKNMAEAEASHGSTVMTDEQWNRAFDLYRQIGSGRPQQEAQR